MKPILWIGIGGFCGAIARFLIGSWLSGTVGASAFPVATFVINITGSFLLGLLAGGASSLTPQVMSALTVGFLGSFTTFSTFSVETLRLIEQNQHLPALFYATGSVAAGLIGAWAGGALGRAFFDS
ncbi:camphor resistance protein CrcB [Planifilum fulgidum]|uniref:Fluoride-specific ion channel FluC n=1 Tax=Planifilum fulgidum TaxID=201973 RepID=A0A1I2SEX5_9BACL|nr:fluoride efflux transporter CrcB [Planifilum fulgidum]SFG51260.1 camphor resistance protein CrcB [Planifilum fulgidum]